MSSKRRFLALAGLLVLTALPAGAAKKKKKPEPNQNKPKAEEKSTIKDDANRALNNLSTGIHDAAGGAKDGANQALQNFNDFIHGRKK